MRKYISAEMRVVRMKNNIIATSVVKGNDPISGSQVGAPQRKSIWE